MTTGARDTEMTKILELHGAPTGNCIRAAIALEEAELPYTVRFVNLANHEQKQSAHLALNPAAKVPVLVEKEADEAPFVITQSNAIVFYAAEKRPGRLLPEDDRARAVAYERFFFFVTDVIAPSHAAFFLGRAGASEARALLTERMLANLAIAEQYPDANGYMAGKSFSIADIAAFTITSSVKEHLPWSQLPNLRRWYERIEARPAVARGYRAFKV